MGRRTARCAKEFTSPAATPTLDEPSRRRENLPGRTSSRRFPCHRSRRPSRVVDEIARRPRDDRRVGQAEPRALPSSSIFTSLSAASKFFESGSLGYSATCDPRRLDGLELKLSRWQVQPFDVPSVHSSYFSNTELFPAGSIEFDHALVMRNAAHEWHRARRSRFERRGKRWLPSRPAFHLHRRSILVKQVSFPRISKQSYSPAPTGLPVVATRMAWMMSPILIASSATKAESAASRLGTS